MLYGAPQTSIYKIRFEVYTERTYVIIATFVVSSLSNVSVPPLISPLCYLPRKEMSFVSLWLIVRPPSLLASPRQGQIAHATLSTPHADSGVYIKYWVETFHFLD